ncbi:MFS transporter [Nisaea sediminum]|uniref:MFS transporter n=1 Tax=Nisaea sediminum TaxID=2775867 RepID=UPI001866BC49|nr:MFS transporter [Nisaea sediminum]
MTDRPDVQADDSGPPPEGSPTGRWSLLRWFASSATLNVPQAASPVAFALLTLGLTGDASQGAALILVMTLAQVLGAVPITRLGRNVAAARYLQLLVSIRTIALVLMAALAFFGIPFVWLFVCAAIAGSVNGAAFGYLRSILNSLTSTAGLPRALGIAATLGEVTFVLSPVIASGLGSISPTFGILALAALGFVPCLIVPHVASVHGEKVQPARTSVLTPAVGLWLLCATVGGAVVASIEIGAVALALKFGYEPALAIMFTVPLCIASISGGIWVSVFNRRLSRPVVVLLLLLMAVGATLAASGLSLATTIVGAVVIGSVIAPLGTYYSLTLDTLVLPEKRAEVFALLRTGNAVGVIFASSVLTAFSITAALGAVAASMFATALLVAAASLPKR